MIDNFHDIATAQTVLGDVASESSISVKFKAHGELSFRNQGNEFSDTRQIFFHPNGANPQGHAVGSGERATNFIELTKLRRIERRGTKREQLYSQIVEKALWITQRVTGAGEKCRFIAAGLEARGDSV